MTEKTNHKSFTASEAKIIGDRLGIDWETFDVKQFRLGLNTEIADGMYNPVTNFASNDPILVGKVVRAHLNERPDYYTYWAQIEKEERAQNSKLTSSQSTTATKLNNC